MYKYERKLVQSYNLKIWKSILYSAKKKKKKKTCWDISKIWQCLFSR
jgi:hypothetical protein